MTRFPGEQIPGIPTGSIPSINGNDPTAGSQNFQLLQPTREIVLGGQTFRARPNSMGDGADFECHLRGMQAASFLKVSEEHGLDVETKALTLAKIYNDPWSPEQKVSHAQSISSIRYLLWRAIHDFQPSITLDQLGSMVTQDHMDEAFAALEALTDKAPLPQTPTISKQTDEAVGQAESEKNSPSKKE